MKNKLTNYQKAKSLNEIYKKAQKFKTEDPSDKQYVLDLLKTMIKKLELPPKELTDALKRVETYISV